MSDFMVTRFEAIRPTANRASKRHPIESLRIALRTHLTRQALPALTMRQRADIGVSLSSALVEASRLPWDTNPIPRRRPVGIMGAIQRAFERVRIRRLMSQLEPRALGEGLSPTDAQAGLSTIFWHR